MFKFLRQQLLFVVVLSWASLLPAQVFSVGSYPVSSGTVGISNIATAPDGSLWYLGSNGSAQSFAVQVSASGATNQFTLSSVTSTPIGSSITTGPDGALWFTAGTGSSAVVARITTGGTITTYTVPSASAFATEPGAIATGSDGALWFTDSGSSQVWRVTTGGSFSTYALSSPSYGITKGPDGNIWTTEYAISALQGGGYAWSGKVASITPSGTVSEFAMPQQNVTLTTNVEMPLDVFTTGPDGALWFTEYSGTQVGRASTSGTVATLYSGGVNGITSGNDGNLWLTQPSGPALVQLTTAGASTNQSLSSPFAKPFGITQGSDGALWFNDAASAVVGHAVLKLAATAACPAPGGSQNSAYTYTLTAAGGQYPLAWSVPAGTLPPGLSLNSSTGVISGTPTSGGTYSLNATVTDSATPTAQSANFNCNNAFVIASGLGISTTSVPNGSVSAAYPNTQLQAQGGTAPYAWAVTVGSLPPGLNLSGGGVISGTPTGTGTFTFTVTASDSGSPAETANQQLSITVSAGAPAGAMAVSGGGQSAGINSAFANPLVVKVSDGSGNPVSGVAVTFSAPSSGPSGSFAGGGTSVSVNTDASGTATSPVFTANGTAGTYNVSATAAGVSGTATFALTNNAGGAATITATSGGGQSAQVNNAFGSPLTAVVKDSGGNAVPNVNVTFVAPGSGPSVTFAGAGATFTTTTNNSGIATSSGLSANGVAGGFSISASVNGVSNTASFGLTNTPGAPASVTAASGGGQTAQINNTFSSALVALVKDASGNPVANVNVTFAAPGSGASGTFSGSGASVTVATNGSGFATSPAFTANSAAGGYNVNATVNGVNGQASFGLANTAGAPANISASSGSGQTVQISNNFGSLVATVKDAGGNPVANVSVSFTAPPVGASGTFSGGMLTATVQTNGSGMAGAPTFTANNIAGSYNVTATVSGVSGAATFALTNSAGGPANIAATSGSGQSAKVNTSFAMPLVATVTDSGGNPVANVTVTFAAPGNSASGTFAGGGGSATAQTNSAGVATSPSFNANGSAGTYSVSASANGVSNSATYQLTNTAGSPGSITANSGAGQSTSINTAFGSPFVVTVKDANGNPVTNATVTFSAPGSGASGTFAGAGLNATATTNGSGIASSPTFTANGTAGGYTVSASVAGAGTPASFGLMNMPGTAASISIGSGTFQSARINSSFSNPLVVLVKDAGGNPVGGVSVTFTAPSSGASGSFAGAGVTSVTTTVQTNSSGIATSPTFAANGITGSYSVYASAPGVSGQLTFALSNVAGIVISTASLPGGTVGMQYSAILTSENGTPPYSWTLGNGVLPAGLSLNAQTGAITGTPGAAGTFQFTAMLTDSSAPTPQTATQALSLTIAAAPTGSVMPTFTISGLPATSSPGTNVTSGTIQLNQASSAAYAGELSFSFAPDSTLSGLPGGYLGDAGFVNSDGTKSATTSVTIPADSTSVSVPGFDPGTVAGTSTISLSVGGQNVATSTVTIAPSAPIIEANSVQITNVTSGGFDVEFVATSTTRDLSNVVFTFTAAAGDKLSGTTTFTVDVSSLLSTWFTSNSGLTYGGAFTLSIPFTLSGSASAIGSVSVTATNSVGTSSAVSGTQ